VPPLPPCKVNLASPAFLDDLRRHSRRREPLKAAVIRKLEHVCADPERLGRRLQDAPQCFKVRVGSDFRLVYLLRDSEVIPLMLYAKNEYSDVRLRDLFQALELVTRRIKG
jgi:mRNA-degrading endonuclease RelE of RelBE toxin-antitoxin system